jgi:hypothetical protein
MSSLSHRRLSSLDPLSVDRGMTSSSHRPLAAGLPIKQRGKDGEMVAAATTDGMEPPCMHGGQASLRPCMSDSFIGMASCAKPSIFAMKRKLRLNYILQLVPFLSLELLLSLQCTLMN